MISSYFSNKTINKPFSIPSSRAKEYFMLDILNDEKRMFSNSKEIQLAGGDIVISKNVEGKSPLLVWNNSENLVCIQKVFGRLITIKPSYKSELTVNDIVFQQNSKLQYKVLVKDLPSGLIGTLRAGNGKKVDQKANKNVSGVKDTKESPKKKKSVIDLNSPEKGDGKSEREPSSPLVKKGKVVSSSKREMKSPNGTRSLGKVKSSNGVKSPQQIRDVEHVKTPTENKMKKARGKKLSMDIEMDADDVVKPVLGGRKRRVIEDSSDDESCDVTASSTATASVVEDDVAMVEVIEKPVHKNRKKKNDAMIVIDSDDDSDRDSDVDSDHFEEESAEDMVAKVMKTCSTIASSLQTAILKWQKNGKENAENDCVSLTTISNSGNTVVRQEDIQFMAKDFTLKGYQIVGVNWLFLLYQHKLSGVLADEMGLGKTVQAIAFLALVKTTALKENGKSMPNLIVVPASVLSNWQREFDRFAPGMKVVTYYGSQKERFDIQDLLLATRNFDVMLTTYTYFEKESATNDRSFLNKFRFRYLILDEGHSIKNADSYRVRRIRKVRSKFRIALTGTPVQNSPQELLAMLTFLMPDIFEHANEGLLEFFEKHAKGSSDDVNKTSQLIKLRVLLSPFILRRKKKDVLQQLPQKVEHVHMIDQDPEQKIVYDMIIREAKEQRAAKTNATTEAIRAKKRSKFDRQLHHLAVGAPKVSITKCIYEPSVIFSNLRKVANHPMLIRNLYNNPQKMKILAKQLHRVDEFGSECSVQMVEKEIETYSDHHLNDLCNQYSANPELKALSLPQEIVFASGKFAHLKKLLQELYANSHRVLLFSQWTSILDILQDFVIYLGYNFVRLDGSTSVSERQSLIDNYNSDSSIYIFLLSTRAGGMGINLTAADTVILHDLDFNPTIDEQACDRCHRIGQTKPVTIYRLVTVNSVDEQIYKIAQEKSALRNTILNEGKGKASAKAKSKAIEKILESILA